ncbi:MAG: hypothetical protein Q8Q62_21250 [Mesorhizobium sp.]|nr:hypothetical protein [Mesorhizobium sp.]
MATTEGMLDGIVALLLSIADLAERAAGAPDAVRHLVLAIIRQGDAVARDFVRAPDRAPGDAEPAAPIHSSSAEDAMALASSLRALALLVRIMGGRTRRLSVLRKGGPMVRVNHLGSDYCRSARIGRCGDMAVSRVHHTDTS